MDEYYRKKLFNKILEENASDYNKLKDMFKHIDIMKLDRNLKVIDFSTWLILVKDYWYSKVQTDTLEEYIVQSIWKGDFESPFELIVIHRNVPVYTKIYYTEESALSAQEKIVFLIEQKIFSPTINC